MDSNTKSHVLVIIIKLTRIIYQKWVLQLYSTCTRPVLNLSPSSYLTVIPLPILMSWKKISGHQTQILKLKNFLSNTEKRWKWVSVVQWKKKLTKRFLDKVCDQW